MICLRQESIAFVFGVMFIVGAYFFYRLKDSDFIGQFALAMSLTGQSFVCVCMARFIRKLNSGLVVHVCYGR
jgi:hypothetical protein